MRNLSGAQTRKAKGRPDRWNHNGHVEELHQFAIEIQTILERIFCNIIINDNIDKVTRKKHYDMESYFVDLILKHHIGK